MRPLVYITAAVLATVAGYWAVYVNFIPQGNNNDTGKVVATVNKEETPVQQPVQKPHKTEDFDFNDIQPAASLEGLNRGDMATFVVRRRPLDIAAVSFQDVNGKDLTMADWSGKVVLLNLWATWCAPCRKEMPDLDRLKEKLGGDKFDVVAISVDRGGIRKPQNFFREISLKHLVLYHDKTSRIGGKLKAFGMPTTILLNPQGKEIGRLIGPANWASEDAVRLIKTAIALQ